MFENILMKSFNLLLSLVINNHLYKSLQILCKRRPEEEEEEQLNL